MSAQRFVDRALAEDDSAPPLQPMSDAPAPVDELDRFIQTKTAETEAEQAKTGRKSAWVASMLMCSGVAITGISYIMADAGERYTLMWGPVAFGFLLWGKSVLQGFGNARTFAWFSAVGSIAVPVALPWSCSVSPSRPSRVKRNCTSQMRNRLKRRVAMP